MKSVLKIFLSAVSFISFSGCYTELATIERSEPSVVYESDTSYDNGTETINNHYYLDDEYRRSRLRVSFNYYYPYSSSWIGGYYNSYFNDYYWGMSYRPAWYYDPFYTVYPPYGWGYYPPHWYGPWYPYYSPYVYYPSYYPVAYGGTPSAPGRSRDGGATRDPLPENRPRPSSPGVPGSGTAVAEHAPADAEPATTPRGGRDSEIPWWEKVSNERPSRGNDSEARPADQDKKPVRDQRPADRETPNSRDEARPAERPKDEQSVTPPVTKERPAREARPATRPKQRPPAYVPPGRQTPSTDEARPAERPRESRQPSYSPPPQQSVAPQSTPPRSSGGSAPSSGNGRKRD